MKKFVTCLGVFLVAVSAFAARYEELTVGTLKVEQVEPLDSTTTGIISNMTVRGTSVVLDGEQITDDSIDDDSIDFSDVTGADLTLTDCGAVTCTVLQASSQFVLVTNLLTVTTLSNVVYNSGATTGNIDYVTWTPNP